MKTTQEFKKCYHTKFFNNDLAWNIERILQGILDRDGIVSAKYGVSLGNGLDDSWFIDIEDSSFFYVEDDQRNLDIDLFEKIVTEFRIANKLKNKNSVFLSNPVKPFTFNKRKMKTLKFYHIHVNYGGNSGFSVFFHLTPVGEMIEADLIGHAIDKGLIEPDDDQYVDQVNEITEEEFKRGINS